MVIELRKVNTLGVIILAAGKGTRMKSPDIAKVMYEINGKPMVDYVVNVAMKLQAERILLVVGWQKQSVIDHISAISSNIEFVEQEQQLGTGHAVLQTDEALKEFDGDLLVLSGDVPLLTEKTAQALIGYHRMSGAMATILTAEVNDPSGYGRIVRNDKGNVQKIVEHKDATNYEAAINEINSGIYVFDKEKVFEALHQLTPNNAQGEYYLTDVFEYFWKKNWQIAAVKALDAVEVMGINDVQQLDMARNILVARASV